MSCIYFFCFGLSTFFIGAVPVLCDSKHDGNIDPEKIEQKITHRTKGISVTHMWGLPCEMDKIAELAERYNLLLFEDFSHAQGATFKGRKVGTFGNVVASSLQAQKIVAAGEGGILLTDTEEIYQRAMLLGHYNKRCLQEIPQAHHLYKYAMTGMGLKFRIHPIGAAIAYQYLNKLDEVLARRRRCAKRMLSSLADLPCFKLPEVKDGIEHAWYAFVLQYEKEQLDNLNISEFYKAIVAEGCLELDRPKSTCPLNYLPLFQTPEALFPTYAGKISYRIGNFPNAEKFHESALKLPVWHDSSDNKIVDLYINGIRKVVTNYKELIFSPHHYFRT